MQCADTELRVCYVMRSTDLARQGVECAVRRQHGCVHSSVVHGGAMYLTARGTELVYGAMTVLCDVRY
eukprot:777886-Rhodomonas_salina.1